MSTELRGTECYVAWDVNLKRAFISTTLRSRSRGLNLLKARSSYLTKKWRVLYVTEVDRFEVLVLEVNPHDY